MESIAYRNVNKVFKREFSNSKVIHLSQSTGSKLILKLIAIFFPFN